MVSTGSTYFFSILYPTSGTYKKGTKEERHLRKEGPGFSTKLQNYFIYYIACHSDFFSEDKVSH
jgi:hypothetical protein